MRPEDKQKLGFLLILLCPFLFWLCAVQHTEIMTHPKWYSYYFVLRATPEKPWLWGAALLGLLFAIGLIWLFTHLSQHHFAGAPFKTFLRGTPVISKRVLQRKTRQKKDLQISVGGIPMPTKIENLHLLVAGSTGSGKSVLLRELVYSAFKRGDRLIIADPNGDMYSKFGRPKDILLNPYDARSQGWSFFNEIRHDYDFKRYALSLIPRGQTKEEEEWRSYGRLLLTETAKKLVLKKESSIQSLFHWTTIADPAHLKAFLSGTAAESLFVGATKALASARFVLASKLAEHLNMSSGDFSLRTWLETGEGTNLFITWREDMAEALKPLISAWIDVLCTSILSLPEDPQRRIWMVVDELASLEKLASLEDAATKGRKAGLRLIAGLQSTAQLNHIYGQEEAQTLRSCFRSLVVLGGAKTDPKTCEDMSLSLGEHEVERQNFSRTKGAKNNTTNEQVQYTRERVVLPSEIASLSDLTGYVAFAGDWPIAKVQLEVLDFVLHEPPFVEREA